MTKIMSELYAEVVGWAVANGAVRIDQTPGVWEGETDEYKVRINPHKEETDGMAFGQMTIEHKTLFAHLAVLFPNGGEVIGTSEAALIDYFREKRLQSEAAA